MHRDTLFVMILFAFSVATGWVGWSGKVLLLPIALVFPVLWSHAPTRKIAALVSAGYFLAASRGLPQGAANFYSSDLWRGFLLWLVASGTFVTVHSALWTAQPGNGRAVRYLLANLLMAIPPFGIMGWAHPLTAAGVLFPEWGWWGVGCAAASLAILTTRLWPTAAKALGGFWLLSAATWTNPHLPDGWRSIDLEMHASLGRDRGLLRQRDLIALVRRQVDDGVRIVVLPESALGFWTPTVERFWLLGLEEANVTVIAGAAVVDPDGYDNVVVEMSKIGGRIAYRQRLPVPGSMWQPWRGWLGQSGGARPHVFANPVVKIDGKRIAPLICYEQLIAWPIVQSMLHDPQAIIAVGNGWWTAGTSIVAIQRASAIAWARLFSKPLVISINT